MAEPQVGQYCPWGYIDSVYKVSPGIWNINTPSHGGIKLDRLHNSMVPEYMRSKGGWYEEDCEWSIPFVVFEGEILMHNAVELDRTINPRKHIETFRNWFPDEYEKFFGTELKPGESLKRDEAIWKSENADKLWVVWAFGDYHERCPKGMVLVGACVGGRAESGNYAGDIREFLVPEDEYKTRGRYSFVVDPSRHQELGIVGGGE